MEIKLQRTHVAVLYECEVCGLLGRTALPVIEWAEIEEKALKSEHSIDLQCRIFAFDLEGVFGVADAALYWQRKTPVAEPPLSVRRCGCRECERLGL